MRIQTLSAFAFTVLFSFSSLADEIAIANVFEPATTISSAQMNENFTLIVDESNENDGRLGAVEQALSALATSTSFTFLGPTANPYVYVNGTGDANGGLFSLNKFCKTEFSSPTAFVATSAHLAAVSRQSNAALWGDQDVWVFAPSPSVGFGTSTTAAGIYSYDPFINTTVSPEEYCYSYRGEVSCGVSRTALNHRLLCVSY